MVEKTEHDGDVLDDALVPVDAALPADGPTTQGQNGHDADAGTGHRGADGAAEPPVDEASADETVADESTDDEGAADGAAAETTAGEPEPVAEQQAAADDAARPADEPRHDGAPAPSSDLAGDAAPSSRPADDDAATSPAARSHDHTTEVMPPVRHDDVPARRDDLPTPPPPAEPAPSAAAPAPGVPVRTSTAAAARTASLPPVASRDTDPDDGHDLRGGSPLDVFEDDDRRRRWLRPLLTTLAIVVVLAGAYVGASWALADRVPRGATVAGVDIGGQDADAAIAQLESELSPLVGEPLPVVAGAQSTVIRPEDAGLALDAEATVDRLTGFDLQPGRLWGQVFGVAEAPAVTSVDDEALDAAVAELDSSLATAPVNGEVVFADGAPHGTPAVDGSELDTEGAADVLRTSWLTGSRPLELPTRVVEPDITQEETDRALSAVAQPLARAPIAVAVADQTVELPAEVVTSFASFTPQDSDLVLELDGPALVEEVVKRTTNLLTPSADARFEFVDGAPVVVPGAAGTTIDPAALVAAVAAAGTGDDRTARVELVPTDPVQSTEKLQALGITEVVSEFSTPLTNEPLRTENLRIGAAKITGVLVEPGDTFSLTESLGPVTAAAGFSEGNVIVNGEHVKGVGGGLSQLSTTVFNTAYFAGFEDVEHTPHSEWFARYPEGREATLYTGSIDLKWKNTSPYGALVQSWVADGRLYVRLWGTKYWTVESTTSGRSNVVAPTTVRSTSPTCAPQSAGNPGFTVTVTRKLFLGGELQDTSSRTTRYKPQNAVVCDAPAPAPAPATQG